MANSLIYYGGADRDRTDDLAGTGLTGLDPTKITSGTAGINISGNAATATTAATATSATTAATASVANTVFNGAITPTKIAFLGNVAIVAPSGGDYDNPATAMDDYLTWCGTPSETNRCLLKIMPGVYDVGTSPVVMQSSIDIEGSGANITTISGAISSVTDPPSDGTVTGAYGAEIRFLTVENRFGVGDFAAAIVNDSKSPSIKEITVKALGSGCNYGIHNSYSSPTMTNIKVEVLNGTTNYGIYNNYGSPTISHTTALAFSGPDNYGIYNIGTSVTMRDVIAEGYGGTHDNYGVYNDSFSSVTMENVSAKGEADAAAGNIACGVYNDESSWVTMTNVTANGDGGTSKYGVYNSGSLNVKINHSLIHGGTSSIYNETTQIRVGNTQLDGAVDVQSGFIICVGAYDADYAGLGTNCQ